MPDGDLHLGETIDPASGQRTGDPVRYDPADLTTHGVIVGMTGSGKTGLAVVLLEEALRRGIPALVLDPKGDMGNLLLRFPQLRPEDFAPWVDPAEAERAGLPTAAFAAQQAERWRTGLASWGLGPPDLEALNAAAEVALYTPGSDAGRPLDLIGNLRAPSADADVEAVRDEVEGVVTSLLRLTGVDADPLSSPEHVLLSNLIHHAWAAGRDLDLATLVAQTLEPPLRKLGVFEVDAFIPPADRRALAMRLNALLASPTFAGWTGGEPLDIERLLRSPDGRPRASIVYLAHLSDEERQFVVTLVLSKLVTWMRGLGGVSGLRALVYMDEVFGFAPPTAMPPAKKPILTILKQARAYGVGMVLATQNPVDLDYKAMSNAGTWLVGRLQTERDKARVLEGLRAAAGGVDPDEIDRLVGGLGARQFLLHNTHDRGGPRLFTTRWAMSYLRGPLTRAEIARLTPRTAAEPAAAPAPEADVPTELRPDESRVAPETPQAVPVHHLNPAAPWAATVRADPQSRRLEPALIARVHLLYDDTRAGVDHREEWEAVLDPLTAAPDPEDAVPVDYDARDFRDAAPEGAVYVLPDISLDGAALYRSFAADLREYLHRNRSVTIWKNAALKLYARVGESEDAFRERCHEAAEDQADAEIAKLRERVAKRVDRVQQAIDRAEERVEQLEVDTKSRRTHEVLAAAGDVLATFLGGQSRSRSLAAKVKGVSSRRALSSRTAQRQRAAEDRLEGETEKLAELQEELEGAIVEIADRWDEQAAAIEEVAIGLEKSDITVDEVALLWIPRG